ncbi:MAG: dTMP kinase [Candidatus Midichloria sp.]|nr:MAG: dTMP kinase [Candidatus Midichloria sp.]
MYFITFEGCDGSGKTTQISLLANHLQSIGLKYIITKEPGGTPLAQEIRSLLLKSEIKDPVTEFALLSAARRDHVTNLIRPSLAQNITVICDRFFDSSLVYQGIKKGLDWDFMVDVHRKLVDNLEPSLTFLLDLEPEMIIERLQRSNNREINHYDAQPTSSHNLIREGFLFLAKKFPSRIIVVNANQPIKNIAKEIFEKFLILINT